MFEADVCMKCCLESQLAPSLVHFENYLLFVRIVHYKLINKTKYLIFLFAHTSMIMYFQ